MKNSLTFPRSTMLIPFSSSHIGSCSSHHHNCLDQGVQKEKFFRYVNNQICTATMPGIMMNSYSSSSRKTMRRSCCIRARTTSSNSCGSTSATYLTSSSGSTEARSASSSTSPSRTDSRNVMNGGYSSGASSPKFAASTRSVDTYFAKTNRNQRKSDEWGHFVDI